jgi:hypothetical protein
LRRRRQVVWDMLAGLGVDVGRRTYGYIQLSSQSPSERASKNRFQITMIHRFYFFQLSPHCVTIGYSPRRTVVVLAKVDQDRVRCPRHRRFLAGLQYA